MRLKVPDFGEVYCFADNDGHGFFQALGDSLVTGPTLTNVNDFRAILIDPQSRP
jgi:hydroxypyruvate reductase